MTRRERLYLRHATALVIGSAVATFGVLGMVDLVAERTINPTVDALSYAVVAAYMIFGGMLIGAAISKIADVHRAERKDAKKVKA